MQELETLLISLLQMGWKPWRVQGLTECGEKLGTLSFFNQKGLHIWHSLRELVSINSGLRQFVVENRVVKENDDVRIKNYQGDNECDTNCCYDDYEYRLIESALIPEEELGQFLIDNIKTE